MSREHDLIRLLAAVEHIRTEWMRRACTDAIQEMSEAGSPASLSKHHTETDGLLTHTAQVVVAARLLAQTYWVGRVVDSEVLITAAVLHDVAKMYETTGTVGLWKKTPYRDLVRHVAGGPMWLDRWLVRTGVWAGVSTTDKYLKTVHAMLAHHGRQEWGSPVEPQTIEAAILHAVDNLSAKHGRAGE